MIVVWAGRCLIPHNCPIAGLGFRGATMTDCVRDTTRCSWTQKHGCITTCNRDWQAQDLAPSPSQSVTRMDNDQR